MFTIHSSVLKQVLIIIIWFVCYFYFSSLCFNYFCQVSALTKQALVYSAHLLYSEPPATQLISFEVAFVPILQRSGRARALPFVKVGLQKGRVTLAELAPCPGRARALASTSAVCPARLIAGLLVKSPIRLFLFAHVCPQMAASTCPLVSLVGFIAADSATCSSATLLPRASPRGLSPARKAAPRNRRRAPSARRPP